MEFAKWKLFVLVLTGKVFFYYYYFKKAIKLMNFEAFIYFFILLSIFFII